jgi:O-antigen ligase
MRVTLIPGLDKVTFVTLLAFLATVSIWNTDPLLVWGYEFAIFTLTGWECLKPRWSFPGVGMPMAAIGLWGFLQLASGATVYRWATINAALQNAALAATALGAFVVLRRPQTRAVFLRGFRWVGLLIALTSVLAYWTSPGKILWIFSSVYPDNWGPFPSRNNFAQFLELCFPVALYEMRRGGRGWTASIAPAAMLGAGLASASRAGAVLLVVEALAVVWLTRGRKRTPVLVFAGCAVAIAAVAGAGTLARRLTENDPLQLRREIYRSSAGMIAQHPWRGYGLGTFATVYPEFAEFDSGATVEHAHSDWLEWTAEGGLFYAGMWACVAVWAVRPALRSVWGLGILAVFLHALVDYPFARLGVSAWAFLLIGALAREAEKTPRRELLRMGRTPWNSKWGNSKLSSPWSRWAARCISGLLSPHRRQSGPRRPREAFEWMTRRSQATQHCLKEPSLRRTSPPPRWI